MNKQLNTYLYLLLIIIGSFTQSCIHSFDFEENKANDKNSTNLSKEQINKAFDWDMSRQISFQVKTVENKKSMKALPLVAIEILNVENEAKIISGTTNKNGVFDGLFQISTTTKNVIVRTSFKDTVVNISNGFLNCVFSTENVQLKGSVISRSRSNSSFSNLLSNYEFDNNISDSLTSKNYSQITTGKWYFKAGNGSNKVFVFRKNISNDYVLKMKNSNNDMWCFQLVDNITAGEIYQLEADAKILNGTNPSNFYVQIQFFNNNVSATALSTYSMNYFSSEWKRKGIVAIAPSNSTKAIVTLRISANESNAKILFDNISLQENPDTDGDGIPDVNDQYPNDEKKAFNNYYPNDCSPATLAFEDLWPYKGDYDFNDLIINYKMNYIANANNKIVELRINYKVVAIGASFHNGFGIQLPVSPSAIKSVSGQQINNSYISLNSNGTEANQSKAVIIMFDDAFDLLPHPGGGDFINTTIGTQYVSPTLVEVVIKFNSSQTIENIGTPPYNPFVIVDGNRDKEIHLPQMQPTDLACSKLLGSGNDNSNPNNNIYYINDDNMPWALNIPTNFYYSKEKSSISDAFNYFDSWAISNGTNHSDWYKNLSGNRNAENIYTH